MKLDQKKFVRIVEIALDALPDKVKSKMHNVVILTADSPTKEQLGKTGRHSRDYMLFGLFEGYGQSSRQNFGPILPDKITIFRKPICSYASNIEEAKQQIINTVKHEIAHHFGSDEKGARQASK